MRHAHLPEKFTRIGLDEEGREYIQCTRTGDVLVQTGDGEWGHFASAREWRARTAAQLYPELIYLQRALKRVGSHEEIEDQLRVLGEALVLLRGLESSIHERIRSLEAERAGGRIDAAGTPEHAR
jgi:hypothetical protein